jgi:NAD(P)-dependent dehydrogenase (short-subunit alcohol dehydrogenase family)
MKKAVIVTGATSGSGYAVCETLLDAGYPILGIGRSMESSAQARATLKQNRPHADLYFVAADLMQQREVLRAAREIKDILATNFCGELHALINNAGGVRSRFMTTEEGYEQQFALNHLAGFQLTHELLPLIRQNDAAVIFTSSSSHKMTKMNWDDLMFQKRYRPLAAYKQSKLCNMLTALSLREMGIRACGVDPGLVKTDIGNKGTSGLVDFVWGLRKGRGISPEESASIYLALCESGFEGLYYGLGSKERRMSTDVSSENAQKLYDISLKLCGYSLESNSSNSKEGMKNERIDYRRGRRARQGVSRGVRKARV